MFMDFSDHREQYGLPAPSLARSTPATPPVDHHPHYRMANDGYRVRPGVASSSAAILAWRIDGSYSDNQLKAQNVDWQMRSPVAGDGGLVLAPPEVGSRLAAAQSSETIAGVDLYDGKAVSDTLDFATASRQNRQTGQQQSQGFTPRTIAVDERTRHDGRPSAPAFRAENE